ncbi:hypothetical protein Vretifemale_13679, partial [Volvox reticuliferus]
MSRSCYSSFLPCQRSFERRAYLPLPCSTGLGHDCFEHMTMIALLITLLVISSFRHGDAETSFVTLRSGRVNLRPATAFGTTQPGGSRSSSSAMASSISSRGRSSSSSSYAVANRLITDGASSGISSSSAAAATAAASSGQLFLMKYSGEAMSMGSKIRTALESGGGRVVSYIPDSTLLVFAASQLAVDVAAKYGALMALYEYDSKLSPEVRSTIDAASSARHRHHRHRQQHRRQRILRASNGDGDDNHRHPPPRDSSLLQNLRTWQWERRHNNNNKSDTSIDRPVGPIHGSLGSPRTGMDYHPEWRADPQRSQSMQRSETVRKEQQEEGRGSGVKPGIHAFNTTNVQLSRRHLRALLRQPSLQLNSSATGAKAVADSVGAAIAASQSFTATTTGSNANGDTADPDLYGIEVHLVPGLPYGVLKDALRQWPAALIQVLRRTGPTDPCRPQADGSGLNGTHSVWMHIYMCAEDIQDGINWLSRLPMATWIAPALQIDIQNDAAGWTIQTGNLTPDRYDNPNTALRPYWGAGIRGEEVLVGIGDTGIDLTHCFFLDERYDIDTLRQAFGGSPLTWKLDHRKIVQYVVANSLDYFGDDGGGHGTHVAGSIAGSIAVGPSPGTTFNESASATGAAPMSRLSFVDLAPPKTGTLSVPIPYDTNYLPLHYRVGAKISSDSWSARGAAAVVYDSGAQSFDSFAWRNPDFISIVAASNNGYNGRMPSVCSPATAKNVISVGGTVNHPKDVTNLGDQFAFVFQYRDASGTTQSQMMSLRSGSGIVAWYMLLNTKPLPIVLAEPRGACNRLSNGNYGKTIVLVDLGDSDCPYAQRMENVQLSGAPAVMFILPDGRFVSDDLPDTIPALITYNVVTQAQGQWIVDILTNGSNSKFFMAFWYYPTVNFGIDSVSSFSGYGPLPDGRIKPDIVAPGGPVRSANASDSPQNGVTRDTCSDATQYQSGTSMSTPLTSGHLALVQQYFRDGFYPQGDKDSAESASFQPSGMLLKAVAIVGAASLKGGIAMQSGATMGQGPDGYQGWGRLNLAGALPLPGLTGPNFRIQVADVGTIEHGDTIYLRGIRATGTGPIRAALVWHDYPGAVQATSSLVNDLDLRFSVNGGSLRTTREDHINNVERAELRGLRAGDDITFVVNGTNIVHRLLSLADTDLPQRWALAVVGDFQGVLQTQFNPSYVQPQRLLPYGTEQATDGSSYFIIRLYDGPCVAIDGMSVVATENCAAPYTFGLVEEKDNSGYFYVARVAPELCVTFRSPSVDSTAYLAPCTDGNDAQRLAVFRNPFSKQLLYHFIPKTSLGMGGKDRLCLGLEQQQFPPPLDWGETAVGGISSSAAIELLPCKAGDPRQTFILESATSPPPLEPSAPPPLTPKPPLVVHTAPLWPPMLPLSAAPPSPPPNLSPDTPAPSPPSPPLLMSPPLLPSSSPSPPPP